MFRGVTVDMMVRGNCCVMAVDIFISAEFSCIPSAQRLLSGFDVLRHSTARRPIELSFPWIPHRQRSTSYPLRHQGRTRVQIVLALAYVILSSHLRGLFALLHVFRGFTPTITGLTGQLVGDESE
jgi:hypothetical protein